jgi:hypothetical protein
LEGQSVPTGLFRTDDGEVQVDCDGTYIPALEVRRNGYQPDFNALPPEADYWAIQEKAKAADTRREEYFRRRRRGRQNEKRWS